MKIKQLLTKTLLVAAGLCVGVSAWGGKVGVVTTNAKVNFNGSITAANPCTYTKGTDEICGTTTGWFWKSADNAANDNGINGEGHFFASNGNISIMMDNPSVGAKDIVNVSFDIAFGGHTSENATQYVKLLTNGSNLVEEMYNNTKVESSTMGLTTDNLESMGFGGSWRNTDWSERVHFNFTVNYATRKITLVVKNTSGTTIIDKEVDMPGDAGYMRGVNIGSSNQKASARGVMFDNINITTTEGDYGNIVSTENSYTVNDTDVYQLFTEIQCPDITLELFGNGSRSTTDYYFKYTEASGWTSYEYNGEEVAYECAVTKYSTTAPTAVDISGANDPTDGQIAKVTVTVSDKWQTETNSSNLCLTGPMGTVTSSYQPISGTIYKFTPTADGYLLINFFKYNSINYRAWVSGNSYYASQKSSNNEMKTWQIWLTKGKTYYLFSEHSMYFQMKMHSFEYIPTLSGTITPAGWATFASSYPLDLSTISGGTAYYASETSGSTVTLTSTTATVPAGEGIMVKGTAGETFTIGVAASGTAISGNLLKGQTTTSNVDASTAGTYHYVFGYKTSDPTEFGFYNLAADTEVAAGKAYLETATELTGARLAIVFADETTGIQSMDNGKWKMDSVYDLQGRRVATPQKGLYIVNGKKVVIK